LLIVAPAHQAAENGLRMAKPETVGMSSQRLQRISRFIKEYIDTNQIAGAVTLVARHGKVVHFGRRGWRYKEADQPTGTDAIFSLASMTKPIASTALMMLWEDGRFVLDDPISKWLPSSAGKEVLVDGRLVKPDRPVTARHVLTHTSGLTLPQVEGQPPAKTLQESIERAASVPLRFQPGTRWLYGDSMDYAGALVAKISGKGLDEFLRERIFEPLAMHDTQYNIPREKVVRVAAVYRPDKGCPYQKLHRHLRRSAPSSGSPAGNSRVRNQAATPLGQQRNNGRATDK
jgi:CubicO group peptidase (beta-lactamase class C family)